MLEYVRAKEEPSPWLRPLSLLWTAADIHEDSPEDAHIITDDMIGVLFHSGDGDGALIIGTPDEVIERMQDTIAMVRQHRPVVDGEVVGDGKQLPTGTIVVEPGADQQAYTTELQQRAIRVLPSAG